MQVATADRVFIFDLLALSGALQPAAPAPATTRDPHAVAAALQAVPGPAAEGIAFAAATQPPAPDAQTAAEAAGPGSSAASPAGLAALDACISPSLLRREVVKLGVGLAGDLKLLHRAYPRVGAFAEPQGLIDLGWAPDCLLQLRPGGQMARALH